MNEIDVTQYTSASDAHNAGAAAFVAANPEPVKPEKTLSFSRPVLITAGSARLWVEVKQDTHWGNEPYDPHFNFRSHGTVESVEMEPGEIRALIEQLTLKLSEMEQATAWKAEYKAWSSAHRIWEEQKEEAGTAARTAWRKAQKALNPTPAANDYTDDEVEEDEDFEEEDYDDSDDE